MILRLKTFLIITFIILFSAQGFSQANRKRTYYFAGTNNPLTPQKIYLILPSGDSYLVLSYNKLPGSNGHDLMIENKVFYTPVTSDSVSLFEKQYKESRAPFCLNEMFSAVKDYQNGIRTSHKFQNAECNIYNIITYKQMLKLLAEKKRTP